MSNISVDPKTMPSWLHGIATVNPITHLATAERGLMKGTATAGELVWVLAAATILTGVFAPLTARFYRNKS